MYALINKGTVVEYPASIPAWRLSNPNVGLPAEPTDAQLEEVGLYRVKLAPQPSVQVGQVAEKSVKYVAKAWTEVWTVRPATAQETEQQVAAITAEIVEQTQARLDAFARTRNYDGILSACTYASSSVPKFAAEGQYCVDMRDQTWATLYTIMGEVTDGARPMPAGYADIEPLLPALAWPATS